MTLDVECQSDLFNLIRSTLCTTLMFLLFSFAVVVFVCVTGVSACMSVFDTMTHSLWFCHWAIKLYCIVKPPSDR